MAAAKICDLELQVSPLVDVSTECACSLALAPLLANAKPHAFTKSNPHYHVPVGAESIVSDLL